MNNAWMVCHDSKNEELEKQIFGGLISQLTKFFRNASAPATINSIILRSLNKLIQNYRSLRFKSSHDGNHDISIENHFSRINIEKTFIQELIGEVDILKTNQSEYTGCQTMFSSYVQNLVDLIVGTLLPTARGEKLSKVSDLVEVPKWLESVVQAAYLLAHLESSKNQLPSDVEELIFEQTNISSQWERVLIVSKLPQEFTRAKIQETLVNIVKNRKGIVADIFIPESNNLEETKQELQAYFDSVKASEDFHKRRIQMYETKIKKKKAQLEEEKAAKEKEEKAKEPHKAAEKAEAPKIEPTEETPKTEEIKQGEVTGDSQPADQVNLDDLVVEQKVEVSQPEIDWTTYSHQRAAIIVLDEFDLSLLTEDDLKQEGEEEKSVVEEIPPELSIYNCPACTLENPMTNESCSICGTPRPPDAGMNNGPKEGVIVEEADATSIIEDKYKTALKNRMNNIITDIKEIVTKLNDEEEALKKERQSKVDKLKAEFEALSVPVIAKVPSEVKQPKSSIQNVEDMNLGQLFIDPDAEAEEQYKPAEEVKASVEEQAKPAENAKEEEVKHQDVKEEDTKQETADEPEKEEPEEVEPVREPRDEVKIFNGTNVDDDFKSE